MAVSVRLASGDNKKKLQRRSFRKPGRGGALGKFQGNGAAATREKKINWKKGM